ncbi:MAG: electron transfer flavoprotein subunit beta/FixA family protein [Actinomycetaceae bacterium]|nr:electron transfer flavoprotein subunit beta/FixA family protein [Actinomycetaceae bacterium]
MRIVVCIKHVPDVQADRRFEGGYLVRGEDDSLNELDENAIEAAVRVVEELGGEVIALTMGPEDAESSVLRALQLGADRGVMVTDDALQGSDVVATASVLASVVMALEAEQPVDLVITGMASLDSMTSMLPGALAEALAWPSLTLASEVMVVPGRVRIKRSADGRDDLLSCPLPALVSVTDQANEPRYPNFAAMAAARKKPIDVWSVDDLRENLREALTGVEVEKAAPLLAGLERLGSAGSGFDVIQAEEAEARQAGTIIQDTGQAGKMIADFIKNALV